MAIINGDNAGNNLVGTSDKDEIFGLGGDDIISGLAGDDTLNGGAGNDAITGGEGNDSLTGGTHDDSYIVDSKDDKIFENDGGGIDAVSSSATFTLSAFVENLTLTGKTAINGTGNEIENHITGNTANNILTGAGGHDILDGKAGNDTLLGGDGNDVLHGDAGADKMIGGDGIDAFDFNSLDGSVDVITDFDTGEGGDILDLSDLLVGFDEGADILGDFVKFVQQGADTLIQVNADGTGVDFVSVALLQNVTLTLGAAVADGNITPDGVL